MSDLVSTLFCEFQIFDELLVSFNEISYRYVDKLKLKYAITGSGSLNVSRYTSRAGEYSENYCSDRSGEITDDKQLSRRIRRSK